MQTIREYVEPVLGAMPVDSIQTEDVLTVLKPLWDSKTATAKKLQTRIDCALDSSAAQGHREQFNPARWKGHLDKILPKPSKVSKTEHRPAMPYKQVAGFMAELCTHETVSARALEFIILTAVRCNEAREAIGARSILKQRPGPFRHQG
jgi:hypothetical protein